MPSLILFEPITLIYDKTVCFSIHDYFLTNQHIQLLTLYSFKQQLKFIYHIITNKIIINKKENLISYSIIIKCLKFKFLNRRV